MTGFGERVRRAPALAAGMALLCLWTACGGGSSSTTDNSQKPGFPNHVTLTPATVSINKGGVTSLTAQVQDINNNVVANQTITFTSSNTAVVSIANSGLVCGGTWDSLTTPVVCTPGPAGQAQVTAKAGSLTSPPVTVFVHDRVDNITVSPANLSGCLSNAQTQQFTAQAFANGQDITSSVGSFFWQTTNQTVVTVNATTGLATAAAPGRAGIFASVGTVNSAPVNFDTCAVQAISTHVQNGTDTTVTLAAAATAQLASDVTDSAGVTIPSASLTYNSSAPAVATVVAGGLISGIAPGTATVIASCTPPSCNSNLGRAVYGNPITITVTGTANSTTVLAASSAGTSMVPIDTSTNTAGTAITLPSAPNSLLINPAGNRAFLGSAAGLMTVDLTTNGVSQVPQVPGKVLAISPDGVKVIVSDVAGGRVRVFDTGSNLVETFIIGNAISADFSPDSFKAFIAAGNTLFVYSPQLVLSNVPPLPVAPRSVAFLDQGSFAYVAGGSASAITVRANCDNSQRDTLATPGTATLMASLPNATQMLAVDSPGIDVITPAITASTSGQQCFPNLNEALVSRDFGQGGFNATQILTTLDSSRAFVLSNKPSILVYKSADKTTSTIPLANGATPLTGGLLVDGSQMYVGASDSNVHRIDLGANTDAQQISVGFVPDLVAVRPK